MSDTYNINQYLGSGEVDSNGDPLPGNFESLPSSNTYTWDDGLPATKVEVKTVSGVGTFTRITNYTNDGDNVLTKAVGDWVKS